MSPRTSSRTPVLLVGCEEGGVDRPSKSAEELFIVVTETAEGASVWWFVFGAGLLLSRISFSGTRPGFFFFRTAKMEDSLSGNAGISSKTVACSMEFQLFKFYLRKDCVKTTIPRWIFIDQFWKFWTIRMTAFFSNFQTNFDFFFKWTQNDSKLLSSIWW